MRDFFEKLMTDEESSRKLTVKEMLVYGVIVPVVMILLMAVVGWMDKMSMGF